MTEPNDIQRLIRLKRHELPPEDFMEDFMRQLHQRQREEMLKQSALSLLWERIGTFLEGRGSPNMGLAAAAAVVVLGGVAWWMPRGGGEASGSVAVHSTVKPVGVVSPASINLSERPPMVVSPQFSFADQERPTPQPARLGEMLLSQHFHGGYADEARDGHGAGAMNVNATQPFSPNAPIDLADPPMQQNGSLERIQNQ